MRKRDTTIAVKTTQEVKDGLRTLAEALGKELGTHVTQTQALEVAISEALGRRKSE